MTLKVKEPPKIKRGNKMLRDTELEEILSSLKKATREQLSQVQEVLNEVIYDNEYEDELRQQLNS